MTKVHSSESSEMTEKIGAELAAALEAKGLKRAFIALCGEMGVGKTAFTRGFCSHFGIRSVKSPTYTVMNEYRGRAAIHHFDFYRIKDADDLYSIGFDDVIEADGYCIGEWSENVWELLPEDKIKVNISRVSNNASEALANMRKIEITSDFI